MRANQFIPEGRVKELAQDLKDKTMSDADFEKKYSKTRADARAAMREPASESVAGPKNCWPGYRKTGTQPGTGKNAGKRVNDCEKIKEQGVAENMYSGTDDTVGFSVNSEAAYQAVMARFGDHVDHDETSGIMYVPERMWPQVEVVAFDADGEGAVQADGLDEGEKIGGRHDADDFDDMVLRLKKLAGAGPMKTVYDPQKRVYKNMPTAQQPAQQPKK